MSWTLVLNAIASLASAVFATVAVNRPGYLSGSKKIEAGESFYVRMYAARSIPFELIAGLLPFWFKGDAVAWMLFTAALIQGLDIVIAVGNRQGGMAVGAAVGAIAHLVCGLAIL